MVENKPIPPQFDLNAKWDACLDLSVRRFVYFSLAGAFGGLLLLRWTGLRSEVTEVTPKLFGFQNFLKIVVAFFPYWLFAMQCQDCPDGSSFNLMY
ncbi:hypothetical protein F0562_028330 [Nyssa sinensis]|uniref:Uncharacterized protein n=1 Tax=Nyssa sinensis TaxID=561372 RepID=A0A5J5B7N4_9ASTE|nr:hypothetical protein F0562_028330 [Nyssa sinensis]